MSAVGRFALRLTSTVALMSFFLFVAGGPLMSALLPAAKKQIEAMEPAYLVNRISYAQGQAGSTIHVRVQQVRCLEFAGRTQCPAADAWAEVTCPAGGFFASLVVAIATCFAWPARLPVEYLWRAAAVLPVVGVAWVSDLPMQIWAAAWALQHDAWAPTAFSPLLAWTEFLQGGGRMALALLLGAMPAAIIGRAVGGHSVGSGHLLVSDQKPSTI